MVRGIALAGRVDVCDNILTIKTSQYRSRSIASPLVTLAAICHRRWALPVLAEFAGRAGLRFAELQAALPVSRQPLRDALMDLVAAGHVERRGGHGHPLRPEYQLTAAAEELAAAAAALRALGDEGGGEALLARKWSLPVLAALLEGPLRFGALTRALGRPAPRALALALRDLEEAGLIERRIDEGRPPTAHYSLEVSSRRRRALERLLNALAD